ncbi:MAG: 16S rRNA (cytosine(967)-C(5))-methyltransferase RsmB [Eubacteriaceae bacterium]|nr:16S rRNA (cytosine(967)-C(5))-methyltransferase RsmB [Eubacteriaceae bacterium]
MKTNIAPARICAYKVLYDVTENGAFSNISLNSHLNSSLKDPADRSLCTNIVYGTLKKKNRLEKIIRGISKVKYENIDPREKVILMMSLYQLFYLKKIPDYALINDAVSMSKFYIGSSVTGYTNALLRSAQRAKGDLMAEEKDFFSLMHYEYGFSEDIIKLLKEQKSENELLEYARASEEAPPLTVRVNTLRVSAEDLAERLSAEGIGSEKTWVPGVISITGGTNVFSSPAYREGLFFAQDISGALSGWCAGFGRGMETLDICSAPGAKSFNASILTEDSPVLSCDISKKKLELVYQSARQLGYRNLHTRRSDATEKNADFEGRFDRVICDVPCSGLGVIRRKPEILFSMTAEKINEIISLQEKITANAAGYVKPAGVMIYSTCTINAGENERAVERILRENPDMRPKEIKLPFELPASHPETADGMLSLVPGKDDSDGFFIAVLEKEK